MVAQRRRKLDQVTWWGGNSTRVWRLTVLIFIGILSFLSAFVFNEVTAIPKLYPNKVEISAMKTDIIGRLGELVGKVDEINRYLRDTKR